VPRFTRLQLYQALLESLASEHSARMVAMRNATRNAEDLVGELTLSYNKARQEAIQRLQDLCDANIRDYDLLRAEPETTP